jgi:hypothetical protein
LGMIFFENRNVPLRSRGLTARNHATITTRRQAGTRLHVIQ